MIRCPHHNFPSPPLSHLHSPPTLPVPTLPPPPSSPSFLPPLPPPPPLISPYY
ncbi:unnamed protein product, partial [Closterium sp. Naga37s-1]